jgi:hypothetical protein
MLKQVPFIINGFGDSSNYSALTWYTDKPCEEDELYKCLKEVNDVVKESLREIEENQV